ncbi:MAG TPA: ATP-binding cassette domain-containing protein [Candidatus Saccharimonadales bacterium]|nr:ATP-binding cassette domain-containing protein [Candidatus Saccharimonadales bacterium]
MLIVKNIVKKFHGKKIIDDVSFSAAQGEIVVLLGQSGVGKSTILRVLNNLETIDSGSIQLDNASIDFKKVGMVFQDFNLFNHMTIEKNLMLPLTKVALKSKQEAQEIAGRQLQRFNLVDKALNYPVALSGGQKQRVALARALCMNPEVLCLDEPTSALDPQLTSDVAKIITQLAQQNMAIVIATHDIGLLENLSCTIHLMRDGKIIESATTKMLQEQPESFTNIKNFIQGK